MVADYFSRLQLQEIPAAIDDSFLDEHLFLINVQNPWYADIANHLATNRIPYHFSSKEKRLLVEKKLHFFLDYRMSILHRTRSDPKKMC